MERLSGLRYDSDGLVPVVIQDASNGRVLTLAYANQEALARTAQTRQTWLYSRSRQALWHKGATSGHTQEVRAMYEDCDRDAVVMIVQPSGPACHTGAVSCFDGAPAFPAYTEGAVLAALEARIAQRAAERPEGSYTTYLFARGLDKMLKKVGEEASEVIIAAKNRDPEELRYETADLFFHLCVLLHEQGVFVQEVLQELQHRFVYGSSPKP
ncbi:MAG: bifunctional phosphoribosyl-AMP cyclohydrolase/phosphoribosyl-ATP diphosphatase HisIE [Firmicutes bacterium]|nr:bifunctional phosphoribosyl-AMP cyclohydrolase/phosphoribosyl-ATP diphosphatase HisIE [Bacillota bacterium]